MVRSLPAGRLRTCFGKLPCERLWSEREARKGDPCLRCGLVYDLRGDRSRQGPAPDFRGLSAVPAEDHLRMHMRKRRTREHVIADLSINHVERCVLRCGWTAERTRYDYGI